MTAFAESDGGLRRRDIIHKEHTEHKEEGLISLP